MKLQDVTNQTFKFSKNELCYYYSHLIKLSEIDLLLVFQSDDVK